MRQGGMAMPPTSIKTTYTQKYTFFMIKTFGDEHKKHNGNKFIWFDIKFAVKVLKITHIHNGKTAENQCYILLFSSDFAKVQNHPLYGCHSPSQHRKPSLNFDAVAL